MLIQRLAKRRDARNTVEVTAMPDTLSHLATIAARCEAPGRLFNEQPLHAEVQRLMLAIEDVGLTWSGSWIGYHAMIYLSGFRPPQSGELFDSDWGLQTSPSSHTRGPWREYSHEQVVAEVLRRARSTGSVDENSIDATARKCRETFDAAREEFLPLLDAMLFGAEDPTLRAIRQEVDELKNSVSREELATLNRPEIVRSYDSDALAQMTARQVVPPHIAYQAWLMSAVSCGHHVGRLGALARRAERYLRARGNMGGAAVDKKAGTVFIGHGHNSAWRDLKDFLRDRIGLVPDEFNMESAAGLSTTERLEEMLDRACFAFLVMTAEDERADGTIHARENVIHEAGLFQGRLGFRKAIVLLEEGCDEFSNIRGLGQIRFPKGNIGAKKDEIRQVLEREGIIPAC